MISDYSLQFGEFLLLPYIFLVRLMEISTYFWKQVLTCKYLFVRVSTAADSIAELAVEKVRKEFENSSYSEDCNHNNLLPMIANLSLIFKPDN